MRIHSYPRIEIFWLNYNFAVFDPTIEMKPKAPTSRPCVMRWLSYSHEQRVHGEAPLALAAPAAAAAPKILLVISHTLLSSLLSSRASYPGSYGEDEERDEGRRREKTKRVGLIRSTGATRATTGNFDGHQSNTNEQTMTFPPEEHWATKPRTKAPEHYHYSNYDGAEPSLSHDATCTQQLSGHDE